MPDIKNCLLENLIVDTEFKSAIPALSEEEYDLLKRSIETEGQRDPMVIWRTSDDKQIICDGHNRFSILKSLSILDAKIIEREFTDRTAAHVWIIENQFGRRNLSVYDRVIALFKVLNAGTPAIIDIKLRKNVVNFSVIAGTPDYFRVLTYNLLPFQRMTSLILRHIIPLSSIKINHRCQNILMPHKPLQCRKPHSIFIAMRCKRVPQAMS